MTETVDCVVIGAGVVGLACARELARCGREVLVLEAARAAGTHSSSRNSEVIHAGIYYPRGSLKAALCVEGRERLYRYCRERQLPHRRLGKLIVATTDSERETLLGYRQAARDNGVEDLQWIEQPQLQHLEPALAGTCALLSPSTGILDSHALMLSLQGDLESNGGLLVCRAPVIAARVVDQGVRLSVGGIDPMEITARTLVNSAGLDAVRVAQRIEGLPAATIPPAYYAKGHYFTLRGKAPFQRLIYPVAGRAGLGIHVTLDMQGRVRFGPDVQWGERDYRFDESRKPLFIEAIRRYYPGLVPDRLEPDYTGVRPKLVPAGEAPHDFVISTAAQHGVGGLVNLFGIESPGLTAALALARRVRAALVP
ncbi:NAD(P)/FAD-dependent oxidoreductase [Exilibacterium tricleocarpae]|uniref:NAD(P)/FAD-dependent oxidoreductase n=1 Tax=Exilibacterium tricleocarpae TaxID=2591008 RepID=A0A545TNL3_9GAMM|nr:NAD(P)/FAD-dependent oxidoreductase [Exilibacterium tricleocarpae]TQV78761.1 NAD(P)/FAD-dependent oxidoreductase [Exilibacterium tricleocarpae]